MSSRDWCVLHASGKRDFSAACDAELRYLFCWSAAYLRYQSGISAIARAPLPLGGEDGSLARITGVARRAVARVAVAYASVRTVLWAGLHRAVGTRPRGYAIARAVDAVSSLVTVARARPLVACVAHPAVVADALP